MKKADELISRQGYTATAVRDIIKAAEIGPASFFDDFTSPKALGLPYLQQQEEQTWHDLSALIEKYFREAVSRGFFKGDSRSGVF